MKKITCLFFFVMLVLTSSIGCAADKKAEGELNSNSQADVIEQNQKDETNVQDKDSYKKESKAEKIINEVTTKRAVKEGKIITKEDLHPIDSDLLYYMDQNTDFLTMKQAGQPSKDNKFYVDALGYDFEIRFYPAEDEYTINHIQLIDRRAETKASVRNDVSGTPSFMGLYLGMPMDLAKDYLQKESPNFDGTLEVKYSDQDGDGLVHQIDVYSKSNLVKTVQSEDFYFKFFDMNIHNESGHMGNGSGAQETVQVDKENRTYTYNITFGADEYQKVYTYNKSNFIESMEIKSSQDEFSAVVPSLFGIQLGCNKDKISQLVETDNKTIYDSRPSPKTESKYDVEEYTIIDNPSKIAYTAEVYTNKRDKKVRKIKGYFKKKTLVDLNDLTDLIGRKLDGNSKKTEGTGTEKWTVEFEAYSDKVIQSVAIYGTEDGFFVNKVPSLYGLRLNMFEIGVPNTLLNNGYKIINEKRYNPFDDEHLEQIKYTVVDNATKKESNIYITSKYIGDISAAIVVRIAISGSH